jgi:P27 family predicted phage terminase small subunit
VTSLLAASGVITRRDRTALAAYCKAVSDYLLYCSDIDEHGITQFSEGGQETQRPALNAKDKAFAQMTKLASHFGLTPSTRSTVNQNNGSETKDTASQFFARIV